MCQLVPIFWNYILGFIVGSTNAHFILDIFQMVIPRGSP